MILSKCPRCKKKINKEVSEDAKMFYCSKCFVMVAVPKEVKGGIEMASKKVVTKTKAVKTEKAEKPVKVETPVEKPVETPKVEKSGVGKVREENAKKVDEFLTNLGADDVEKRKICSRLYGNIVIRQKQA